MPYKIYSKNGYKVCKPGGKKCFSKKGLSKEKAQAQQKALYAAEGGYVKEALDAKQVGSNLEFKSVIPTMDSTEASVYYKVKSEPNTDLIVVYSLQETPEQTDYEYFVIHDKNDPKGRPQKFEDPSAEETKKHLAIYDLTSEDIEMAGQDGYEKIVDNVFKGPETLKEPYEEGLDFEKLFHSILNEEKP